MMHAGILAWYLTSNQAKLSLAIPLWVGAIRVVTPTAREETTVLQLQAGCLPMSSATSALALRVLHNGLIWQLKTTVTMSAHKVKGKMRVSYIWALDPATFLLTFS